jgi:hypothetical protein
MNLKNSCVLNLRIREEKLIVKEDQTLEVMAWVDKTKIKTGNNLLKDKNQIYQTEVVLQCKITTISPDLATLIWECLKGVNHKTDHHLCKEEICQWAEEMLDHLEQEVLLTLAIWEICSETIPSKDPKLKND